ncbi:hypothetical protein ACFOGJ_25695 [Marinibaculum pumilum]|uniref:DUF2783 domain-containing protein n=1 Tax=Marinibaculum pumilum TaxID=1766165 RepID=A0ABV7L8H7_9PROT
MTMPFAELEPVYEELAMAIDRVGEAQAPLFLAKLALMLAHELGDRERALAAIADCERDLLRE